jgi:hypothetical protein
MPVRNDRTSNTPTRSRRERFSRAVVDAIDEATILGVRAGSRSDHRFIGVWPVVVDGRVFARSWTQKPNGWYRRLLDDPVGVIQIGERELRFRAVRPRGTRIISAMEREYARKYPTPASRKYVRGFKSAKRRAATIEFVPR